MQMDGGSPSLGGVDLISVRKQLKEFEKRFVAEHDRPASRRELPPSIGAHLAGRRARRDGGVAPRLSSLLELSMVRVCGHVFAADLYARYAQLKSDKQQHSQRQRTPPPTSAATVKPGPTDYGFAADADKRTKRIPDHLMDTHQVHQRFCGR